MKHLRPALTLFLSFSLITGFLYPIVTTFIGQTFFPAQVSGSLIRHGQHIVGSELIGQPFSLPRYFWGRLSATTPMPYNGIASSGSNLAQSNPAWMDAVQKRIAELKQADPNNQQGIPVDLITASASGLDPHISPEAAYYQVSRIARVRHVSPEWIRSLVERHTEGQSWHLLGEARVNVLKLNQALDQAPNPERNGLATGTDQHAPQS
jgi:potassium-transporting ATPase KdpC subunit